SSTTRSTLVPGRDCASRAATDKPETPSAHPRPNTGTRATSTLNPISPARRASKVGVAMPVEQTVTTVSMSLAATGTRDRVLRDSDEQRFRSIQKCVRTFRPAAWLEIPFDRLDAVAAADARIGKQTRKRFELLVAMRQNTARGFQNLLLMELMR